MTRATRMLAVLVLPGMALVAAAAPQLVVTLFGQDWDPAIPIVQVLAMAGAVQAIYQPSTTPLLLGLGHAALNLEVCIAHRGGVDGWDRGGPSVWPIRSGCRLCLCGRRGGVDHQATPARVGDTYAGSEPCAGGSRRRLGRRCVHARGGQHRLGVCDIIVLACGVLIGFATGLGIMRAFHRSQLSELVLLTNRMIRRTKQGAVVEGREVCRDAYPDGRVHDGPHAPLPRHAVDESQPPSFVGMPMPESMRYALRPFLRRADAYPFVVDAAYRGEIDA